MKRQSYAATLSERGADVVHVIQGSATGRRGFDVKCDAKCIGNTKAGVRG
jgi:hypothetical protein